MANLLVIGGGGREHAICWKLGQSDKISKIYALPGSVGIGQLPKVEIVSGLPEGFAVRFGFLSDCLRVSYQIPLIAGRSGVL